MAMAFATGSFRPSDPGNLAPKRSHQRSETYQLRENKTAAIDEHDGGSSRGSFDEEKTSTLDRASDTSSSPEKSLSLFSESGAARTTQDDVNRTRELIRAAEGTKKHLLNPTSQWMKSFDVASTCALVFTAVITPVEVAFFLSEDGTGTPSSPLFWANRVVDLIFVTEMVQTFFLPFKDSNDGNRWVRRHRDIVRHYLRGWFVVDLVSLLPYGLLGRALESSQVEQLQGIRVIRLLRLLKLTRMARLSRIAAVFEKWEMEVAVPYAKLALIKYASTVLLAMHWFACLWGLAAETQALGDDADDADDEGGGAREPTFTWVAALEGSKLGADGVTPVMKFNSPGRKYLAALYYALYTITSVGYGDIAPQTELEYAINVTIIFLGALIWAYTIGSFCATLSSMDQHTVATRHTLDELNYFMEDNNLPLPLRARLRRYVHMCKMLRRNQAQKALLSSLSPTLSNEVVDHCYRSWIAKVWYLNLPGISNDFIQRVANALGAELFAPMELIETHDTLYIITCGLAMRNGQLIRKGDVWNEDFLLPFASSEEALQRARCVTAAFSYIEVLALSHEAFFQELHEFPHEAKIIKKASRWYGAKRAIVQWALDTLREENDKKKQKFALDCHNSGQKILNTMQRRTAMSRMLSQRAMSTRSLNAAISNAASVGVGRVAPLNASNGSSSPHRLKTGSQDHPHHPAEAHSNTGSGGRVTAAQVEEIVGRAEARLREQMREETQNAVKEILAALPGAAVTPAAGSGQAD